MALKNPEYRIFEVDKYGNRWFVTSTRQRDWAEAEIQRLPPLENEAKYEIQEA